MKEAVAYNSKTSQNQQIIEMEETSGDHLVQHPAQSKVKLEKVVLVPCTVKFLISPMLVTPWSLWTICVTTWPSLKFNM